MYKQYYGIHTIIVYSIAHMKQALTEEAL